MKKLLLLVALVGGLTVFASSKSAEAGYGYGGGYNAGYRSAGYGGLSGYRTQNFGYRNFGGYNNWHSRQSYVPHFDHNYRPTYVPQYAPSYGGCGY